jgi:hypothetical protein
VVTNQEIDLLLGAPMLFNGLLVGLLLAVMNAKLSAAEAKSDQRFDMIDRRFDMVDRRFDALAHGAASRGRSDRRAVASSRRTISFLCVTLKT